MASTTSYNERTKRLTKKLHKLSMEMESLPTNTQKEWQVNLKSCFTDPSTALVKVLQDISLLNDELDQALSDGTFKLNSLSTYQEYLDAFIGLYIHVKAFVGRTRKEGDVSPVLREVFSSLSKQKCPTMSLFRRLAKDPLYIASDDHESKEMFVSETCCLPVTQMARMCDVAILRFLSSVTNKTNPDSIVWALDYLTEMTKHLDASLRAQSELGWCGIRFRKRKDTIRRSLIEAPKLAPQLALDGRLLVVGFGAPQSPTPGAPILEPDGDSPVNSIPAIILSDGANSSPTPRRTRRNSRDENRVAPNMTTPFPPVQILSEGQPRQRRTSREETPRRRSSVTTPPMKSILEVPQRRSSTGTNPFASSGPPPSRKTSRAGSPLPVIATILEEDSNSSHSSNGRPKVPNNLLLDAQQTLRPSSPNFIPGSASPTTLFRTPSPTLSSNSFLDARTPTEPYKSILSDSTSEEEEEESVEEEVKSKRSSSSQALAALDNTNRCGSPSPSIACLKYLTAEHLEKEMNSLVTAEGRISLLALLQAITHLPSSLHDLWLEGSWDACQKCFQLIQFCMDFGLDTPQPASQQRYATYTAHDETSSASNLERPAKTYSRLVLQHSLLALIHCAKSMYTGCFSDGCRLSIYNLNNSHGAGQILNKMTHQLERLYSNSSLHFRAVAMSFARHAPCRQVFHFLHVILQYCPKGPGKDPLDPSLSKRDPLIVLTAAMLRIMVDRLNELDLTEPSIQQGIVQEAIAFVHFSQCLFSQDFLRQRSYNHLYHYIHRVALSVLLPIAPPDSPSTLSAQPSLEKTVQLEFGTFPRKRNRAEGGEGVRKRAPTVIGTGYEAKQGSKRNPLQKQPSLHRDPGNTSNGTDTPITNKEWRGLNLTVLQMRVRRLSLLMELSEPGKIPDPSLLASLIAVGAPGSVVPRVLVFLEFALFVQRLREGHRTLWLQNLQNEGELISLDVLLQLQKSGKMVGEALRQIELSEKELQSQSASVCFSTSLDETTPTTLLTAEEPVFPDEERNPEKRYTVSYSVKMAACLFLLELTKLLKEPPESLHPLLGSSSQAASAFTRSMSSERRPSNMSSVSTDSESSRPGFPNPHEARPYRRLSSEVHLSSGQHGPPLEDIPKFTSLDAPSSSGLLDAPSSSSSRKLSIYLKVSGRPGRVSRAPIHHPRVSHYARPGETQIPPDTFKATSPTQSPTKSSFRTRRMSSGAAFPPSKLQRQPSHEGSVRYHAQPTVTLSAHQKINRRMSMAVGGYERVKKDSSPNPPHPPQSNTRLQPQTSSSNLKVTGSPTSAHSRHRVSVITRFRKFAFRGHKGKTSESTKKRASTTTQTSSRSSSPMTFRRGNSHSYARSESMAYSVLDDIQRNFPWLDVVEHLVTSAQCSEPDVRAQRRRACQDLIQALLQVYDGQDSTQAESRTGSAQSSGDQRCGLGTIFTDVVIPVRGGTSQLPARDRGDSSPLVTHFDAQVASKQQLTNATEIMSRLDFSGIPLNCFLLLGMEGINIENSLEMDCATAPSVRSQQLNQERVNFIHGTMAGLLHAPFSLIVYAAPVLPLETFINLREIAWDTLLDTDRDLLAAAAAFFLLSCSKEKDRGVKKFIQDKIKEASSSNTAKKQIIDRFVVLWRSRGTVWSRMEEYAQTHFMGGSEEDGSTQDSQVIGYSVPTNLLVSGDDVIPHAPWQPASVCSNRTCMRHSEKCYQGTPHAPLYHLDDVVGVAKQCSVSALNIQYETGFLENTYVAVVDHQDYEQGIITITDRLSSNLFPSSLLPLISFVISTLNHWPSSEPNSGSEQAGEITTISEVSAAAEVAVWQCLVDNSQLFFAPLLDQFNALYQQVKERTPIENLQREGDIAKPFQTLLAHFSPLPPKTAQFLFVHFVGIIMRHSEQALSRSSTIKHCVLELLRMVAPGVQGLSMKELKNSLKKESCYTTILSTARIRGVEKICLITHDNQKDEQEVEENEMTFALLMVKKLQQELQNVIHHYYLRDEKTRIPVLSSLVVQDHYAAHTDTHIPEFSIQHEPDRMKETMVWKQQLDMLFVHKMSECSRLIFTSEMLHSSFNESSSPGKKRYAIPNHRFTYSELLELSSFPRKALDSLPYEMGPQALSKPQLSVSDNMLRGSWVRFMHNLFVKLEKDFPVDDSIILFLSVVTGSLLLQCEDQTVLRSCLATLLTAAVKFTSVFKLTGYQMVVPTLVQVYTLHSKNKLVTDAIKFIWVHFYWLSENRFLLQVIASVANLLSSEVGNLAILLGVNYSPLNVGLSEEEEDEEKEQLSKTLMELLEALSSPFDELPKDSLDVLGECPPEVGSKFQKDKEQSWSPCTLKTFITVCITVASFNPEVLRGMQVLVVLDRLMPLLVRKLDYQALTPAVRSLIKGCDSIKRHPGLRSDFFTRRPDNETNQAEEGPHPPHVRRLLFFRRRLGTSQELPNQAHTRTHSVSEFANFDSYIDGFRDRTRKQQDASQKVLRVVCASLLSITSQLARHVNMVGCASVGATSESSKQLNGARKLQLDLSSLQTLSTIAIQLLRLGSKVHYEEILYSRGLVRFMRDLLPCLEWNNDNMTVFGNILERLVKLFRKIQSETSKLSFPVWGGLTAFLQGVLLCVQHNKFMITDSEPITTKLKMLLDIFLTVKSGGVASGGIGISRPKITHQLIYEAPKPFITAIVDLSVEMILTTRSYQKHKVQFDTLFRGKLDFKERDLSEFYWINFFLPVITQLGLRDNSLFTEEDMSFVMDLIRSVSSHISVHIARSIQSTQLVKRYFNVLKVLICAMSRQFTLEHWLGITHLITSITTEFDSRSLLRTDNISIVRSYGVFVHFCNFFLDFMEKFVISSHAPLLCFLWPLVSLIEKHLQTAQHLVCIQEDPALSSAISSCLDQCSSIRSWGGLFCTAESRDELLAMLQLELHSPCSSSPPPTASETSPPAASTCDEQPAQIPRLKRKNSRPPNFPVIQEIVEGDSTTTTQAIDVPKSDVVPKLQHRPTTLTLNESGQSSPKIGLRSFSPSTKPKVTFADKEMVVQSKTMPLRKSLKKGSSEDKSRQPPARRRFMRGGRGSHKRVENSFDADDEEVDSPRTSFSYPAGTWPGHQDSLSTSSSMNTVTTNIDLESLGSPSSADFKTVAAIIHDRQSPPPFEPSDHTHHNIRSFSSNKGSKMLQRQEAVETPSEDDEEDEEEEEEDVSFPKLIMKPTKSSGHGNGNTVSVTMETNNAQSNEDGDEGSDLFQTSLKKSLIFLSSSIPESRVL